MIWRAITCSLWMISPRHRIGAQGTSAASRRSSHRLRGEHGGGLVAYDRADHLRTVGDRLRLDIGEAGQALDDRIVDALLHVRAGIADAADRDVDQARMPLAQLFYAESEPLH